MDPSFPRIKEMAPTPARPAPLNISESAAKRISALIAAENRPGAKLRVSVSGGGCAGFQYHFSLDEASEADDVVIERDGATVAIDGMSLMYVLGSELDFVEDLTGSYFRVKNPNASSSCGCGTSFAI
jgi:iron-sulfur cluster insertion protein